MSTLIRTAAISLRMLLENPDDPLTRQLAQTVLAKLEAPSAEIQTAAPTADKIEPLARPRLEPRGAVAYGYRWAPGRVGIEKNPDELKVLARISDLRDQGLTFKAIAEALNSQGLRPRVGDRWNLQTVRNQLLNLQDDPRVAEDVRPYLEKQSTPHKSLENE